MNNDFLTFIQLTKENPQRYSKAIHKLISKQEQMLKKYDFLESKGNKIIDWIENYCCLVEGEHVGEKLVLPLWQKWVIHSIFSFYGNIQSPYFDNQYNFMGYKDNYVRIVNDVTLLVASGNSKTTFLAALNSYFLFSKDFESPQIFIGSDAYKISKLCFTSTQKMLYKNPSLKKYVTFRPSSGEVEVVKNNSKMTSMSSVGDNAEGIIPFCTIFDEVHTMSDSSYIDNIKKSAKREDQLFFELSTQGTKRGGYLDNRLEYLRSILNGDVKNDRTLPIIFEQDNEEEIFQALNDKEYAVLFKSNPSLGVTISTSIILAKIQEMLDNPEKRTATLTKSFNIPQNPTSCYFSERECRTKTFDEAIFNQAPVFFGLDMAYTRSPENDLTCLTMMTKNPFTEEEYYKDFYFLPKYWDYQTKFNGEILIEKLDMIQAKSKYDTNILYDEKSQKYGYKLYADRGDLIIIDENLINTLVDIYGEDARFDCTGITEKFIYYFLAYLERTYGFITCKFGLDPNKASEIESLTNSHIASLDGLPPVIKFQMERHDISNAILQSTKDIRARELVYCNNKLTELHFANALGKEKSSGATVLTNSKRSRKDGVISHLAARSAYNVFVNNSKTGALNKQLLMNIWSKKLNEQIQN